MSYNKSKNLPLQDGIGHYGHEGMAFDNIFSGPPFHVGQSKELAWQPFTGPSSPVEGGFRDAQT